MRKNFQTNRNKNSNSVFIACSIAGLVLMTIFGIGIFANIDAYAAPRPKVKSTKKAATQNPAHLYLRNSVWRTSECGQSHGFQTFNFSNPHKVEVGNGKLGEGEKLYIVSSGRTGNIVEVKTRVCAPVGCNQTLEEYKVLNENQMQEWRFEGHLPNEAPNIVVANGVASDGSVGRVFNRCRG